MQTWKSNWKKASPKQSILSGGPAWAPSHKVHQRLVNTFDKNADMYHHFGFCRHSKIDAVITLFQCKYHLHNIQCVKTHFQPLKRRFCPCDCTYCARQCTWCHFDAHIWSCAEFQIFTLKCFIYPIYVHIIHLEMILNDMEKWLISPKTWYMYRQFGLDWHSRIAAVITLFQSSYHTVFAHWILWRWYLDWNSLMTASILECLPNPKWWYIYRVFWRYQPFFHIIQNHL